MTAPGRASRARRSALLALALASTVGCSQAIYTSAVSRAGLCGARTPLVEIGRDWDKARVLAAIGPPGEIVPQPDGDLFIYRLRTIDQDIWNLSDNSTGVDLTVFQYFDGLDQDHALYCWFDRHGRLAQLASARIRGR